jgi:hypothetical protein
MTFFNPETDPDPDRRQKINPAGLYFVVPTTE